MHMQMQLRTVVEHLSRDQQSGAAEMLSTALRALGSLPSEEKISDDEWQEFALSLHRAKPTIAPIFNLSNLILLGVEDHTSEALPARFRELLAREGMANISIAQHAASTIVGYRFMTISYSSTVRAALNAIAAQGPIEVVVAEALPGGEGRRFAHLLAGDGISTEIISDSTIFSRTPMVDAILTGADSVSPTGVVNKIGTTALVVSANRVGRKAYALCGSTKMSPVALTNMMIKTKEVEKNLTEYVQVFEPTPLDHFTAIVTEQGPLMTNQVRDELNNTRLAKAWYKQGILDQHGTLSTRSA